MNNQLSQARNPLASLTTLRSATASVAPDGGHAALCPYIETASRSAGLPPMPEHVARRHLARLHAKGGNARQWLAALMGEIGHVPDHKHFRVAPPRSGLSAHDRPTLTVHFATQRAWLAARRCCRAAQITVRARINSLFQLHALRGDTQHLGGHPHLRCSVAPAAGSPRSPIRRQTSATPGRRIEKHHAGLLALDGAKVPFQCSAWHSSEIEPAISTLVGPALPITTKVRAALCISGSVVVSWRFRRHLGIRRRNSRASERVFKPGA